MTDPKRLTAAKEAAAARKRGCTRAEFRAEMNLSRANADECWTDADVILSEAAVTSDLDWRESSP